VPTVGLVAQQKRMFQRYLSQLNILAQSGEQDSKLPLKDLMPQYDVIVMTPQIMLNSLSNDDKMSLSLFTLLIFDECHHTMKNNPYNGIMGHYIDEKFEAENMKKTVHLPQVLILCYLPVQSVLVSAVNTDDCSVIPSKRCCINHPIVVPPSHFDVHLHILYRHCTDSIYFEFL